LKVNRERPNNLMPDARLQSSNGIDKPFVQFRQILGPQSLAHFPYFLNMFQQFPTTLMHEHFTENVT